MTCDRPTVLLIPSDRADRKLHTHAHDCAWVAATRGLNYQPVATADVPADQPRCSYCGGGR